MKAPSLPPVKHLTFPLKGGLDLVTPPMSLAPGAARDALNWEVSVTGGYSQILGYERFDGHASPTDAVYGIVVLSSVAGLAVGNTLATAGATASGVVIAIDGRAVAYTRAVGAFAVGDAVAVGATPIGAVTSLGSMLTAQQSAAYTALAANHYRASIAAVPGSGPVRGIACLAGAVYAWRDNAGGTALGLYRSTTAGWAAVALGHELAFTAGVAAPAAGATVTGATSGATGVVARVVLESGSWGGTAAGRLILSATAGTFAAGEALRVAGVTKATAAGAAAAITLLPGGRVQTVKSNFGGAQPTRLYGCDGVNRGFELDSTAYVPIRTGMTADAPTNVLVHRSYLFFTFGPSLQFSALGLPYQWQPLLGAGEAVVAGDITALGILPGDQSTGAMAVWWGDGLSILYGSSAANFQLAPFEGGGGARRYSAQNLDQPYALADHGVTSLAASRNFGNFDASTLTLGIRPLVQQHRARTSASAVNRERSQYRVFFSDGYGLYLTIINGKFAGVMPVFFPQPVLCWCEGWATDRSEMSFFGSSDGMVYCMDTGPSFDGAPIPRTLTLAFNAIGDPRVLKRFRKAALEVTGDGYSEMSVGYLIGYADAAERDQPPAASYGTPLSNPRWDAFTWDAFFWDGRSLAPIEVAMDGSAENIALTVTDTGSIYPPFTINTVTLHYTPRRGLR